MKKLVLALTLLFFLGCVEKPRGLTFSPYKPMYEDKIKSLSVKKIYIKSIIDLRQSSSTIGTYEENDSVFVVETNTDLRSWFYESLENAFTQKGYIVTPKLENDALILKVYINRQSADFREKFYSKYNMFGDIELKVVYQSKTNKTIKDINVKNRGFYEKFPDKTEFEHFIRDMLKISVDEVVHKVISF